jgi:hypothetical protein
MLQHTRPAPARPQLRALPSTHVFGDPRRASVGDANADELEAKVNALADARFGGHTTAQIKKLFLSYDKNGDGCAGRNEVEELLSDAGVGNWVTRGYWVDGVFDKLDVNPKNDCITWEEYRVGSGLKDDAPKPAAPPADSDKTDKTKNPGALVVKPSDPTAWPTGVATAESAAAKPATALSTYAGPAIAGTLGALWLGIPYGVALGLGWFAAGRWKSA